MNTERQSSAYMETVSSPHRVLAYVVRGDWKPESTTFPVPDGLSLQLGFVVYAAGGEVPRHVHVPVERHLTDTCEVLVVREGRCEVDFYDGPQRTFVSSITLQRGDVVLLVAGGHGLRMLEDTVLLEVKQGPYGGLKEKERF